MRGTDLPYTSIVPSWMYPPVPWPLPGIKSAKPISSTLLRSGLGTHISLFGFAAAGPLFNVTTRSGSNLIQRTFVTENSLRLNLGTEEKARSPTTRVPFASFNTGRTTWKPDVFVNHRMLARPVRSTLLFFSLNVTAKGLSAVPVHTP